MGNKTSNERVPKNREDVETLKGEEGPHKNEQELTGMINLRLDLFS